MEENMYGENLKNIGKVNNMTMIESFFLILYLNSALSVYMIGKIKDLDERIKNIIIVDIVSMQIIDKTMKKYKFYATIPVFNTIYALFYLFSGEMKKSIAS